MNKPSDIFAKILLILLFSICLTLPLVAQNSEVNKPEETNKPPTKTKEQTKQPITLRVGGKTVYKDEDGTVITQAQFREKQFGANYLTEIETSNGVMTGLKLKKGNPETEIGAIPPDFTATLSDGSPIQLNHLKGKIVVINFWFISCSPCIKEMPELNELVKKYEGKEVEFIAATFDSKEETNEFFKNRQFNYKQIVAARNLITLYKITAYPTHLILDQDGKVIFTQLGYNSKIIEQMTKLIDAALNTN